MKLLYMGTAAAEGIPALFCDCEFCHRARAAGGREIRTRSGAMIDGVLKLDFGPDSYLHMLRESIGYAGLRSVLITHTHGDHLALDELGYRGPFFANLPEDAPPLTVYGNGELGRRLESKLSDRLAYRQIRPFEPVMIEGYRVTALEAVHCLNAKSGQWPVTFEGSVYTRSEEALFYLVEKDGQSILYAHDTDEFTPADMEYLAGKRIDLISMDCTNGVLDLEYIGHMGANDNLRMQEKLLANGAADGHTLFVASHFSHNGCAELAELERALPGFTIAWDGLTLETPSA